MADIHASAEETNILTSLVNYLRTNLEGAAGPPTKIAAASWAWPYDSFNSDDKDYFVRVKVEEMEGRKYRTVSGANRGSWMFWVLTLQLFMKREYSGNDLLLFPKTSTLIKSEFKDRDVVTVLDYRGAQANLGGLVVRSRSKFNPTPESDWLSRGWRIEFEWIEQDAVSA